MNYELMTDYTARRMTANFAIVLVVLPNKEIIRFVLPVEKTLWDIKVNIASFVCCSPSSLELVYEKQVFKPWVPIDMLPKEPTDKPTYLFYAAFNFFDDASDETPVVIEEVAKVHEDKFRILIQNRAYIHEWCGGFRHKITGIYYFNTWTQTRPKSYITKELEPKETRLNQLVQTPYFPIVDTGVETDHTVGTQTWFRDLHIPSVGDRIIEPRNYSSALETQEQQYFMHIVIMKRFRDICRDMIKRRKVIRKLKRHKEIIDRERRDWNTTLLEYTTDIIFPTRRIGFENLYSIVNHWYEDERAKLLAEYADVNDGVFRTCSVDLFNKKVKLLYEIDKMRVKHRNSALHKKELKKFEDASKPNVRIYNKGNITTTFSVENQTAMEFKELYCSYVKNDYSKEQRLELLLELRQFLFSFNCTEVTKPVTDLVDREIDLTALGNKYLDGLRKRVSDLLLNFLTREEFKLVGYKGMDSISPVTYQCPSCMKLKPPSAFTRCNTLNSRYCTACAWLVDRNASKPGLYPYMVMLQRVKEEENLTDNYIPFLVKPEDIKTLVDEIWEGQSVLSGNEYKLEIRIPKWDQRLPWSPWNCIVLTISEASIHLDYDDVENCYTEEIVKRIKSKHKAAEMRFHQLKVLDFMKKDREAFLMRPIPKNKLKEIKLKDDSFYRKVHFNIRGGY